MRKRSCIAAILALGALGLPGEAVADEIADEIKAALQSYQAGNISEARSNLEFAMQLLAQKKAGDLVSALPAPLPGWEAEDEQSSAPMGLFGGGVSATRTYRKDDREVRISVLGDSPMLQAVAAMFDNPSIISASGGRVKRVGGQKVIVTGDGEFQLMAGKMMLTIDGNADQKDKEAYLQKIDIKKLSGF